MEEKQLNKIAEMLGFSNYRYMPAFHVKQLEEAAQSLVNIFDLLGENSSRDGLQDTPFRFIKALTEHTCMSGRGIKKHGAKTVTSTMRGLFETDSSARAELLQLIK